LQILKSGIYGYFSFSLFLKGLQIRRIQELGLQIPMTGSTFVPSYVLGFSLSVLGFYSRYGNRETQKAHRTANEYRAKNQDNRAKNQDNKTKI